MLVPTTIFSNINGSVRSKENIRELVTLDMSKLFVALIFAAFAFNYYHILDAGESENKIDEEARGTKRKAVDVDNQPVRQDVPESNVPESHDVGSITDDSTATLAYDPLIIIANKDEFFTIRSDAATLLPFSRVQIVSEDQSTSPDSGEEKIYLCRYETWMDEFQSVLPPNTYPYLLHFEKKPPHKCSTPLISVTLNIGKEFQPHNCHEDQSMKLQSSGMQFAYPIVTENKNEDDKDKNDEHEENNDEDEDDEDKENNNEEYTWKVMDMETLLTEVNKGKIKKSDITISTRVLEMYKHCYGDKEERTSWIQREVAPWTELTTRPYSREISDRSTTFHILVPQVENYPTTWKNLIPFPGIAVPILTKLTPLIDLIDDRLQQYSKKESRPIKVMTKIVYPANKHNQIVHEQRVGDLVYTYVEPEKLITQAYDEKIKTAITFVIYNTLENVPQNSPCKETAQCDFVKWAEMSPFFKTYTDVIEAYMKSAHCCKSTKDDFQMLLNYEIKGVMELNWETEEGSEMHLD